jgi:hypothetical protein
VATHTLFVEEKCKNTLEQQAIEELPRRVTVYFRVQTFRLRSLRGRELSIIRDLA